ncbi:MAG: MEDS domain-containing protein [Candidatus Omnitrophota bacterium]
MSGHHCLYYDSLKDLCGVVASFLRDGIRKNMLCLWILPGGLDAEAAKVALRESLGDLDQYVGSGQLEIREFHDWYTRSGAFNPEETLKACGQKESEALARGFSGLCVIGDGSWLLREDREKLLTYESVAAEVISQSKITALCTYATEKLSEEERRIMSQHHDVSISHRHGTLAISN